jgi:NAD(P)-dependent dehydrogenase (short-subunit alcohol dehydrogenase family)
VDFAENLGAVTALVNNAGVTGPISPFTDLTDEDLRRVVEVNLIAPTRLCRGVARRWASDTSSESTSAGRAIVNISSVAARTGAPGEYVAYAAAKAGVETLTIGLAKELAPVGIRVNAVSPGTTDTTIHARAGEPGRAQRVVASIPLDRPGTRDCREGQRHLVMDNYAGHKIAEVKVWPAENLSFRAHFTPTSTSWLNVVEMWFWNHRAPVPAPI